MADITIDGTTIGANRFLILDSTGKIPAVDGSQVTAIAAGNIATGTIPVARIDTGSTANKIVVLDGSGRLPAVSAALITNLSSSTKSASDPAIDTNPSGGVGTEWHNTTSGEVYICTDATAGANVWTNVGAGTGDVVPIPHYHDGSNYGYASGGDISPSAPMTTNVIDRFAHASSANATDVGNLSKIKAYLGGALSSTHGYTIGGWNYIPGEGQPHGGLVDIDKFSFASATTNASNIGDLAVLRSQILGNTSETHGYGSGGSANPSDVPTAYNSIEKFPYATDSNATDVGDTTPTNHIQRAATSNSETHGYLASGDDYYGNSPAGYEYFNMIQKFAFASDGNSTDTGADVIRAGRTQTQNLQSSTHGYIGGASLFSPADTANENRIEKYSFAASTNSTDVGNLTRDGDFVCSASLTTYGYTMGGDTSNRTNVIDRFSFTSDGNASDVGDLTVGRYAPVGSYF